MLAGLVAGIGIAAGVALILGLFTRVAAFLLVGVAATAIVLTKLPVLLGTGFLAFGGVDAGFYGLWGFLYEWRLDFSMLVGSLFLLVAGPGARSLDERLGTRSVFDRLDRRASV